MRSFLILIGGKILAGLVVLLTFALVRKVLGINYVTFSTTYAYLILLTTLCGGALSGIILLKALTFENSSFEITTYSIVFFMVAMFLIETSIFFGIISNDFRIATYVFLLSNLLFSVTLVDFQITQNFFAMSALDITRVGIPLVGIFFLQTSHISITIKDLFYLISLGNLIGVFLYYRNIKFKSYQSFGKLNFLKLNWKSDLIYILSFAAFNWLTQLLITIDRANIVKFYSNKEKSALIAYTGDQITKLSNGLLFPLNTKVSSVIGQLMLEKKYEHVKSLLNRYTVYSVVLSLGLILLSTLLFFFDNIGDLKFDLSSVFYYLVGNCLLMGCLINQKRFDYTKYKFWPALLMLLSIGASILITEFTKSSFNIFFLAIALYSSTLTISIIIFLQRSSNEAFHS